MGGITGQKPDDLVTAIVTALVDQTITGNNGFTLKMKRSNEPTDVSSAGQSWETGVIIVKDDIQEIEPGIAGTPPGWKWRANIEVQVTFRRPQDVSLRQGNQIILRRKVANLIDNALMNAGAGQTIWPIAERRLPPLELAPDAPEFYLIRYMFQVDSWWDYS